MKENRMATATNTESLISVSEITGMLNADTETFLRYCASQGVNVCIPSGAISDINTFVVGFRAFQAQSDATKLNALFHNQSNSGVAVATPTLDANANGAKTELTAPEPVTTDAPTETTETPTTQKNWKMAKQGKTMLETVKNLVAKNDPAYNSAYNSGFVTGLRNREPGIVSFVNGVTTKYYKETPGAEKRMWTAIDKFLGELDVQSPAPTVEKKSRGGRKKTATD